MASLVACDVCEQVESKSFDPDVLSHIKHLDISKYITDKSPTAIAYGGFSEVFRGQLQRDSDEHEHVGVAIKRLRFHVDESKVKKAGRFLNIVQKICRLTRKAQQFAKEVYVWSKLCHPNVLPLLGFAICEETRFPLLISEWMRLGTAWAYVRNHDLTPSEIVELVCIVSIRFKRSGWLTKVDTRRSIGFGISARARCDTLRYESGTFL